MKKLLFLIILGVLGSCKDNCPDPNGTGNNGTGNTGGPGTEYTIKGKLLNGTTLEPINSGMMMTLIAQNNGLAVKREELGACKIQPDGSFELKYLYSEVAAISTAFMRFESQFYISEYLPRNQSLDTVLYESDSGQIVINFRKIEINEGDTFFFAHYDHDLRTDRIVIVDTIEQIKEGLYKEIRTSDPQKVFWWGQGSLEFYQYLAKNSETIKISRDPYIDTLIIEY
jgi:hypothetical protein